MRCDYKAYGPLVVYVGQELFLGDTPIFFDVSWSTLWYSYLVIPQSLG